MTIRKYIDILNEAEDPNQEHFDALKKTGFFGARGAGAIFLAKDSNRFLISYRSAYVEQPHTYGSWGGAINSGENIEESLKREIHEETQYNGELQLVPLYVFKKDTFRYYNFLAIVPHEFTPTLDWENDGFKWCEFGDWPTPLHFGLIALFNDAESIRTIKQIMHQDLNEVYGPTGMDAALDSLYMKLRLANSYTPISSIIKKVAYWAKVSESDLIFSFTKKYGKSPQDFIKNID